MAIKEFFRKYQPLQIYIVLVLTIFYFLIQLIVSHFTHALTLLVEAYHVLCNLIALFGCIASFKYKDESERCVNSSLQKSSLGSSDTMKTQSDSIQTKCSPSETRLRNTFGWARIDVLVLLIGCIFLTSLCFSLTLEAAQTLGHISHHDAMHQPLQVLLVGATGLVLNGFCYLMIGGYTYYQGSFLRVGHSGDITLSKGMTDMMSTENPMARTQFKPKRQGPWEMTRDSIGCVIVMICSIIVYMTDASVAKYVDPILAIISALLLLLFSYPYMLDAGYILLQTIPNHIDIDSLCSELVEAFPNILNVHEIHVWQLTPSKTVSTAHIIFLNPQDYLRSTTKLIEFFHNQGISHVTIQPEFYKNPNEMELISSKFGSTQCLIRCMSEECTRRHCCSVDSDELVAVKIADETKLGESGSPTSVCRIQNVKQEEKVLRKPSHCSQHKRQYMRNSTPILHLLKSTQHSTKRVQIRKAGSMSPSCSKSCVQLQLRDYQAAASLQRSLSVDQLK
uniref:Zinc transporter 10 n=1 Tax=Cacopsylla melanoneura TaxID=428564 RepID=A0A8D8TQA7_9HEMI